MTTINDLIDSALAGKINDIKDQFDTLVRAKIDSNIDDMRPAVHSSIFNAPKVEAVSEARQFHVKFKDKSNGQWFKSRTFKSQNEMTQYFWSKIKPVAGEVQFHGPTGRLAESLELLETTLEDINEHLTEGRDDSTYTLNDRKFKTKAFSNQAEATAFIERNPAYGVLADADGVIHVAKNKSKETN